MSEAIKPPPQEQPQPQPLGQEQEALTLLLLQDCRRMIQAGHRPVLGLNGPVGSGKSTLSRQLRQDFARAGLQLAVASIDDAYLPWAERRQRMAGNPFGVSRVPPGSHDPAALAEPILCWREQPWSGDGRATAALDLPRFDKTLRDGEGDRTTNWHGQADVVLLEGWLLGCRPVPEHELLAWSAAAGLNAGLAAAQQSGPADLSAALGHDRSTRAAVASKLEPAAPLALSGGGPPAAQRWRLAQAGAAGSAGAGHAAIAACSALPTSPAARGPLGA
jgi:pantothenate kinase-related protein Tda10